jgi:DNA polymerase-3 subunit alpha
LEDILKETFGVMVYQEQVLQIARTLAGYSLGGADLLRRAMGKKIQSEMNAQRKIFVEGVLSHHGGTEEQATLLFDQIAKFAGYAFAKAHAAPYALITYQTAYLKANFPVHFMAASLTLDAHNTDKIAHFAQEVRRMGLPLFPADLNRSDVFFRVEKSPDGVLGIRYGLAALKNVGASAMEAVVQERNKGGPFESLYAFFERLSDSKILNKRQMESLIQAGALDTLHPNRRELLSSLEVLLKYGTQKSTTSSLFSVEETRPPLTREPPFSVLEQLRHEFAAVGFYLSQHPLDVYRENLAALQAIPSTQVAPFLETAPEGRVPEGRVPEGRPFTMAGALISKKEKMSRAGNRYAFLQLSDPQGVFEVTVFADTLAKHRELLEPGKGLLLLVTGRMEEDALRLLVQDIKDLDTVLSQHTTELEVSLTDAQELEALAAVLQRAAPGKARIKLVLCVPHPQQANRLCAARFLLPQQVLASGDLKATLERFENRGAGNP